MRKDKGKEADGEENRLKAKETNQEKKKENKTKSQRKQRKQTQRNRREGNKPTKRTETSLFSPTRLQQRQESRIEDLQCNHQQWFSQVHM